MQPTTRTTTARTTTVLDGLPVGRKPRRPARGRLAAWVGCATGCLVGLTGCVDLGADVPPLEAFDLPEDATAARIRGGDEIVYVTPDEQQFEYAFYLAGPDETQTEHELVASTPAENFGFEAGETLATPTTVSMSDDLDRAVVGFGDRSYLLERSATPTAQVVNAFTVTPLTAFGSPVFNPALSPRGNRLAFETPSGRIGTATVQTAGVVTDVGLLDTGINPVFGAGGRLGFSNPTMTQFFVNDLATGTRTTFDVTAPDLVNIPRPFDGFEAGLTPGGINRVGVFVATDPLVVDPGPF